MTAIRKDIVRAAYNRVYTLMDTTIYDTLDKAHEFKTKTILVDESLTNDEKLEQHYIVNIVFGII
ncbi:hypothetical protein C1645_838481 [Glomus cerebriforme]|uniref:Uncharacterized protein n=1 Tax=Glomus cerebriforme TaxID=658196 RepID=A0A397S2D4_9GLOM|nr:hypothetical protein C1645_838481 [Glomus cerebriforme]